MVADRLLGSTMSSSPFWVTKMEVVMTTATFGTTFGATTTTTVSEATTNTRQPGPVAQAFRGLIHEVSTINPVDVVKAACGKIS
jgi:hypothetical protein